MKKPPCKAALSEVSVSPNQTRQHRQHGHRVRAQADRGVPGSPGASRRSEGPSWPLPQRGSRVSAVDAARSADLLALIGHDVQLRRAASMHGGEYAGPCPQCGGTDRFRVWPHRVPPGFWCRQCGWKGDAITYLRAVDGLSFPAAVRQLGGVLPDRPARPRLVPAPQAKQTAKNGPRRKVVGRSHWIVEGYWHGRLDFDDGDKAFYWRRWFSAEQC